VGRSGNGVLPFDGGDTHARFPLRPPDANAILTALDLQLGDSAVVYYCDQFSNLFNCHGIRF